MLVEPQSLAASVDVKPPVLRFASDADRKMLAPALRVDRDGTLRVAGALRALSGATHTFEIVAGGGDDAADTNEAATFALTVAAISQCRAHFAVDMRPPPVLFVKTAAALDGSEAIGQLTAATPATCVMRYELHNDEAALFTINSTDGRIFARLDDDKNLRHKARFPVCHRSLQAIETLAILQLTLDAIDIDGERASLPIEVRIRSDAATRIASTPPRFVAQNLSLQVAESVQIGATIGWLQAEPSNDRADDKDRRSFRLAAPSSFFAVRPQTGEIVTQRSLDRETQARHELQVNARLPIQDDDRCSMR